ncbi:MULTISPECIES: SLC13 family permease [unclassified Streptomyces]|uniref:SLC13 family permease n=1 Tax=unclassified Streptomyces TaxID=2593676 RepID=UPI002DDA3ACC|nr:MULTISPECIES: SLC13 family permease [unclassified Streptomyces]WSB74552.1 SLC13 family permease [Streptomyces sp. NBC_01775]WSS17064.1 SLC13 family permease [Streptomyces sp. NBC_01186]WSS45807.1 SLC13 family permease [Streptomyces sp. NBC_01187]
MSPEVISIGALLVMFVVGTVLPINLGILAFVATFAVGTASLGLTEDEIFEGFPVDLFVTIVGVTYLFSVASRNGTIDLLVTAGVRLVRGKVALIPWVLFLVAALLTAFGTFTPAAVALLVPIGMNFAYRYKLNPLVIGMMVISGGHAGAFSPLAVSGALVLGLVDKTALHVSPVTLFAASFVINLLLSLLTYMLLAKRPVPPAERDEATADDEEPAVSGMPDWRQWLTLACLVALVVGALGFQLEVGFLALAAGALLALVDMKRQEKAVDGISWPTLLLVGGMMTYIAMLEKAGIIEEISEHTAKLGAPLVVALLLCFTVAITSAFASSTAILTAIIPLAVPLLLSSHLSAAGLIAALAVSTTIVDTSPFSTNGALVLANARGVDTRRFYRQIIGYTGSIVALGPVVAWGALVLPWS